MDGNAGIVDQYVPPAELTDCPVHHGVDIIRFGDITLDGDGLSPDSLNGFGGFFRGWKVNIVNGDVGALPGKKQSKSLTDAAACPGY